MGHSVGQVAGFAGVTVRTLHHYDEIGLLSPSGRNHAGHRRYDDADLDRLQRILFYRELGFPLDEVAVLLDDPESDPREHLRRQHALLTDRIARLQQMAKAVEHAMEAKKMGIDLTPEERFEVFGDKDPERYEQEARERWGDTETYAESRRRAAGYTKDDWKLMQDQVADWGVRYSALMDAGEPADGERAMDMAEEHRQHIGTWFYDCGYELHTCLGDMYVSDERFKEFYDSMRAGLAEHLRDAITANAIRKA
ncbi:MerR family transcriptional regulator [Streptomyces sp. NPDC060334]|uniref:MerR family transcriptional regulator n=1 Tax=unclassified Streptomyces TaxID=2593676 RepID=UPI0006ADE7FF|nr:MULTISPECIES: MerR family transcriptional regulator [unclassified Streptomyces]KOU55633.1 transcriptional regulator [Streptomyces sp. WM4235]MCX5074754.1 MerR family transcriptional regulator [Streptomyces sp. NBC_00424]MCX5153634.1 MerR family transcriptional regulator [Streptomyces sp. NBC_00291]WUD42076.1 MerR family transcriptional regulator [Streptomyces sp. NBC_00513]